MNNYAQIVDGIVTQVVVCDSLEWLVNTLGGLWILDSVEIAGIGMLYLNGQFISQES